MAELYNLGVSRIFYKAKGFVTAVSVTAYIWSPSLAQSSLLSFTEVGEGLYYLDYDFAEEGTYLTKVYENGVPRTQGAFRVKDLITVLAQVQATAGGGLSIE